MTGREAIEAMLQGKVVVSGSFMWRFADGFEAKEPHAKHWYADSFFGGAEAGTYELYQEPNPNEPGTYAWAREEHARKNAVRNDCTGAVYTWGLSWSAYSFMDAEFETKTWRRA